MTATFDLGAHESSDTERAQRVLDDAKADHAFTVALDHARSLGGRSGLRRLNTYTSQIAAAEAELLAEHVLDSGDTRRARSLLNDGKTSKREQHKKANRAKAVGKNASLASKLAGGQIGEEQLDVIADASNKTDGDAACDDELINKVAAVPPEQGKCIVDDYVAKRATRDGVQTEHDRQRALRRATKYRSKKDGLDTIALPGDGVASKNMWEAINKRANEIYKRDGGRNLPHNKHPRTRDQRKFDAAHELICGITTTPNGRTTPTATDSGPATSETIDEAAPPSKRYTPPAARPAIVIGLSVDKMLGKDPAAIAIQHGLGLIPDSVLANYANDADILTILYDRTGEPLWLGRLRRYASSTQYIALILRDRHCVLCGADHNRCQAHHTMPWNAPSQGRTNLDDLVLLCEPCHQQLHAEQQTIYQDHHSTWRTRPATPNELPPPRPTTDRNPPQQE